MSALTPTLDKQSLAFLMGGGEMGKRTREFDWSNTCIGEPEKWPKSLQTAVNICLSSRYPIVIWWKNHSFIQFYNDAYIPILGNSKHPGCFGRSGEECWSEIWPTMKPMLNTVFLTGEATWSEDFMWFLDRNLPQEETYVTFSYSPIRNDNGEVDGIFCACNETTSRVIGERRMRILRELSAHSTNEVKAVEEACLVLARILGDNPKDVPFALQYLLNEDGKTALLAGSTGIAPDTFVSPLKIDLSSTQNTPWPFNKVMTSGGKVVVSEFPKEFPTLPGGPWSEAANHALVLPIKKTGQTQLAGFLIVGVSSRRPLDEDYLGFFDLLATQVSIAIANSQAYEEERRRAESLAELDRVKTIFFSNVSHEFRTPLTLMLGPIEELLNNANEENLALLQIVHRNGLRLKRLVNTLLDFSKIETGRVNACFEPMDISLFTIDLVSNFRSACDRAGLKLEVDCPPINQPVFLDRSMWEQIILNLLSNAFKFTFEGRIKVSLRQESQSVELKVSDTGIGISEEEIPRIFERFHRIENAHGRTYEGSGIGLALVYELVKLQGGEVRVESELGYGTSFIITLPFGSAHLPKEQIRFNQAQSYEEIKIQPFLEEAANWLPDLVEPLASQEQNLTMNSSCRSAAPRILIVDDNADMRHYLERLLLEFYHIETASNGRLALNAIHEQTPDLIITDVMMPQLDGFELVKELRGNPTTAGIPIIMLSARAGEESRVDGVQAGADDYLVKPFSRRILLATVAAQLKMANLRTQAQEAIQESEKRFRALVSATSDVVYCMSPDWKQLRSLQGKEFILDTNESSTSWPDKYIHPDDQPHVRQAVQVALQAKEPFELEHRLIRKNGTIGWTSSRAVPICDKDNEIVEWFGIVSDITSRKEAEHALLESSRHKDEFLATLAHELRNPLAPLSNGLQMLPFAQGNPELFDKICALMGRQLDQMVRLIDDLLDLSRISCGKIILQKEPTELTNILVQALESNRSLIDKANQEVDFDASALSIFVDGDATRLIQIFSNLLNNASKYTQEGGKIHLSIEEKKDEVQIIIKDNGIGIPANMLPHVFEMFTQVDRHLDRSQSGLGIGLSVVKKLIELHNGRVEVHSEGEHLGSEFIVCLPIISSFHKEKSNNVVPLRPVSNRRILVVDDNIDVVTSLSMLLEIMGNTTKVAGNGIDAINLAAVFQPHLIFMDIGMPGLNGNDTARAIRKNPWGKEIILVALTGWGQNEDRRKSQEAGFDFHLTKPILKTTLEKLFADLEYVRA